MEQRSAPIDVMLDDMKRQQIEENRKLLRPIIGAIVLCGRQNIPLRGHRDDSSNYLSDEVNCGNFIEILKYGAMCADKQCQIREEFLGFVPCKKGVSGEAVAATIEEFLRDQNLPIDDCRGQGYDGAGNMAGRLSGVAARIQETNKKALYVHCNSHRLNLCVATCCKEQLAGMTIINIPEPPTGWVGASC
ncbi:uncharacterized protein LOC114541141 [Dendronephthya gigantea]|uniref:uncharacterized protein LOC114541141 n=1 Tax=Dendronephthya gigantea TaxID=151771 RepID=UPI00106AF681|nr:uncharacterized protein LOC114541141 [Dendronephthya gigantea]